MHSDEMDPRVGGLKTFEECESFARNAIERSLPDLATQAHKRGIELLAESHGAQTAVERDCLAAVYAYEAVLTKKHGRKTRAGRTWPMIESLGIIPAVERIVDRPAETDAYFALLNMGLKDYLFEAVILRHTEHFSARAIERSRSRLAEHNGD